jgi:hypothetical protein
MMTMKNEQKLTVLHPRGQPTGIFGRSTKPGCNPGWILDPTNQPSTNIAEMEGTKMASRLATLEGKTVFLVETGFAGANDFMEELQIWFNTHMPKVKTEFRHTKNGVFSDDPELWVEIKKNGDAAIIGVGG